MTVITIQLRGFFTYNQVAMLLAPLRRAMRSLRVKNIQTPRAVTPKELPHVFTQFNTAHLCANDSEGHESAMENQSPTKSDGYVPDFLWLASDQVNQNAPAND